MPFVFAIVSGKCYFHMQDCVFCVKFRQFFPKNVIGNVFGNESFKWRSFTESAIFDTLFTFLNHQGKDTKIPSAHISRIQRRNLKNILLVLLTFYRTNLSCMVSL